jgi:hypothetical protein
LRDEHPENAPVGIVFMVVGITTVTKEEHSKKENTPMELTELGIDTANNFGDPEKA